MAALVCMCSPSSCRFCSPLQAPYPDAAAKLVSHIIKSSRHLRKLAVRLLHVTAPPTAATAAAPAGGGAEEAERFPAVASLERLLAATRTLFFPTSPNAQRMTRWLSSLTTEFSNRIARQSAVTQAAALLGDAGAGGGGEGVQVAVIPPEAAGRFVRAALPLLSLGLYYPGRAFDCNTTGVALQVRADRVFTLSQGPLVCGCAA
jgi:hypothetical protein